METEHNEKLEQFKADFMRRVKEIKKTRWWRFGIVAALFFAWVVWLGTWWVGLFIILLFDIYITGYIPFTWWKKSKSNAVRTIMSWVDAIVYALILVYFVFNFVGQNYQIPSSSLEKTLLTGDYLWVNKMAYGPRVPMTPIHFPLVHNTLPFINTKSYLEWPELEYHRLKGYRNIETGDIVVFNFPAGDTVTAKVSNPDYYTLVKGYGHEIVNNDKATFGDIIYRPVDRRENYVKRCVGLPGERLKIVDGVIYINGKAQKQPKDVQFNYFVSASSPISDSEWENLGVSVDDRQQYIFDQNSQTYIHVLPLTSTMVNTLKENNKVLNIERCPGSDKNLFPEYISETEGWDCENYGGKDGILIPEKGMTIKLNAETWDMYHRCIRNYERNYNAYLKGNTVYINGKPADKYTFKMDYYFMMGDNRDNSLDSRFWGFVPEDHIVGTPMFVLISFDKDKSLFNGGIRWNRIFKDANPDY